jgi:hypothetical protein
MKMILGKEYLSATAFAVRSTFHTSLQSTPGQLVFGRDMIFNIQHTANWEYIKQRKQHIIDLNNKRENSKRQATCLPCRRQSAIK